uniref:Uncharacterized protein n=1 Tax=Chromera velia CCMP2878 TaxID=1169474 RepID=A0A0G4H3B9_9ALVE|eukprot:Cvel_24514.t1-p1 / transcript=Cvel_24514.t1 / gene=Cvel_24514 / organism=Chromera_velia_CCMP2878 / gene_product=hypothetical protein / transcript_product=hypothetical protein / location=Cvel_scaffold2659:13096-13521(-) / protein_length=142 / sequence_SO=supercontig / SO=protein_coding / is_pseudo=false
MGHLPGREVPGGPEQLYYYDGSVSGIDQSEDSGCHHRMMEVEEPHIFSEEHNIDKDTEVADSPEGGLTTEDAFRSLPLPDRKDNKEMMESAINDGEFRERGFPPSTDRMRRISVFISARGTPKRQLLHVLIDSCTFGNLMPA